MVVIRLTRGGAKKRPFYHIVATDKHSRRDGRFIERIGYFNPVAPESETSLVMSVDRIGHWQKQGAQLSPTVAKLVRQYSKQQAGQGVQGGAAPEPAAATAADADVAA